MNNNGLLQVRDYLVFFILSLMDFLTITLLFYFSFFLRGLLVEREILNNPLSFSENYVKFTLFVSLLLIIILAYEGLYSQRKIFLEEAKILFKSISLWFLLVSSVLLLIREVDWLSRFIFVSVWLLAILLLPLIKYFVKFILFGYRYFQNNAGIIGTDDLCISAQTGMQSHKYLGYRFVGFISFTADKKNELVDTLGNLEDLPFIVKRHTLSTLFISTSGGQKRVSKAVSAARTLVAQVMLIPDIRGVTLNSTELHYLFDQRIFLLKLGNKLHSAMNIHLKRLFDLVLSLLLLPVFSLILLIIGVIIKWESHGPVFFKQPRLGKNGKIFNCYKFRTMYTDSDSILTNLLESDAHARKEWELFRKIKRHDPRITKVGKILRITSLDELAQLLNVLRGEMSLVGARPYMLDEKDRIGDNFKLLMEATPGITGLWQVSGRNRLTFEQRVSLDCWYVLNWSLWLDVVILFKTIKVVLKRDGVH